MNLNEYQTKASETDTYGYDKLGIAARFMGLSGEAGEATDKAKKEIRDHMNDAFLNKERNLEIAKELGDTLWYVSQCASAIGYSLEGIAELNIEKLKSRKERNVISGSGDNR